MKILNTLEHTLLGSDDKASIKRIMSAISFITYISLCIYYAHNHTEFVIGSLVTMIFGLVGITTYANINTPPNQNTQNTQNNNPLEK